MLALLFLFAVCVFGADQPGNLNLPSSQQTPQYQDPTHIQPTHSWFNQPQPSHYPQLYFVTPLDALPCYLNCFHNQIMTVYNNKLHLASSNTVGVIDGHKQYLDRELCGLRIFINPDSMNDKDIISWDCYTNFQLFEWAFEQIVETGKYFLKQGMFNLENLLTLPKPDHKHHLIESCVALHTLLNDVMLWCSSRLPESHPYDAVMDPSLTVVNAAVMTMYLREVCKQSNGGGVGVPSLLTPDLDYYSGSNNFILKRRQQLGFPLACLILRIDYHGDDDHVYLTLLSMLSMAWSEACQLFPNHSPLPSQNVMLSFAESLTTDDESLWRRTVSRPNYSQPVNRLLEGSVSVAYSVTKSIFDGEDALPTSIGLLDTRKSLKAYAVSVIEMYNLFCMQNRKTVPKIAELDPVVGVDDALLEKQLRLLLQENDAPSEMISEMTAVKMMQIVVDLKAGRKDQVFLRSISLVPDEPSEYTKDYEGNEEVEEGEVEGGENCDDDNEEEEDDDDVEVNGPQDDDQTDGMEVDTEPYVIRYAADDLKQGIKRPISQVYNEGDEDDVHSQPDGNRKKRRADSTPSSSYSNAMASVENSSKVDNYFDSIFNDDLDEELESTETTPLRGHFNISGGIIDGFRDKVIAARRRLIKRMSLPLPSLCETNLVCYAARLIKAINDGLGDAPSFEDLDGEYVADADEAILLLKSALNRPDANIDLKSLIIFAGEILDNSQ